MLRRKLAESLTVRIFLLTFLLLLGAGGLTFALIAWATPITYTAVISDRLQAQVADLTQQLAQTNLADAGPILDAFVRESGAEEAIFKAILRKLGFPRSQFDQPLEAYSAGQKKKVLLARSLCEAAHLYIWDEPLNYVDIYTRMQLEELLLIYRPTMVFVEHDQAFTDKVATKVIEL